MNNTEQNRQETRAGRDAYNAAGDITVINHYARRIRRRRRRRGSGGGCGGTFRRRIAGSPAGRNS